MSPSRCMSVSTIAIAAMLPSVIAVSKARDTRITDGLGLEPLDARSLALSVAARLAPAGAARPGARRTRRVVRHRRRDDAHRPVADGRGRRARGRRRRYGLAGRLLDRQQAQDIGRRQPGQRWDGGWHTVIAAADQRRLADRRRFRTVMANHRFGELRPDIWMRPANLPAPSPGSDLIVTTGPTGRASTGSSLRDRLLGRRRARSPRSGAAGHRRTPTPRHRLGRPGIDSRCVRHLGRGRAVPARRAPVATRPRSR